MPQHRLLDDALPLCLEDEADAAQADAHEGGVGDDQGRARLLLEGVHQAQDEAHDEADDRQTGVEPADPRTDEQDREGHAGLDDDVVVGHPLRLQRTGGRAGVGLLKLLDAGGVNPGGGRAATGRHRLRPGKDGVSALHVSPSTDQTGSSAVRVDRSLPIVTAEAAFCIPTFAISPVTTGLWPAPRPGGGRWCA